MGGVGQTGTRELGLCVGMRPNSARPHGPLLALHVAFFPVKWEVGAGMCATHYTRVSPWGHAHPREPGHTATRGRARLRGLSALRAARQGHTRPRSLTPTPRRRRFRARVPAPPGNLTGRAGMSSRRRPPPLNSLQMPGGPRSRLRRAPALGRPLQVAGGQLRGRGLGCATGKGRGFSRSPAPCLSWAPGGGLREAALPAPRGFQAKARDPP